MNYIREKTQKVLQRGARDQAARSAAGDERDGFALIPVTAWLLAFLVYVGFALLCYLVLIPQDAKMRHWQEWQKALFAFGMPLLFIAWILLIGYVYGDAKRRRMRHVMWTLLAVFVPNAVGIILYFLLRDPLPAPCPKCGEIASGALSFCPHCGAALAPMCPHCQRPVGQDWASCGYCGAKLGTSAAQT